MSQQVIDDFRGGLDVRKHMLSAPAGTLTDAVNCHITPGAEIEKRKAFQRAAGLTGTFGLLALANSLMVFDSTDRSGTFPQALLGQTVAFQRLQHPAMLDGSGTAYDAAKHAMTAIIATTQFGGKAVAAAIFTDGKSYGYYDGGLMFDLTDGLVLSQLNTTAKIAAALASAVNRTANYTATVNGSTVTINGTNGAAFSYDTDNVSAAGTMAVSKLNDPQPGIDAAQATGKFMVLRGQVGGYFLGATVNGVDITSLGAKANIAGAAVRTVSRARAGSIVTLVYGFVHSLSVGDIVEISNVGGANYNGVFAVTSVPDKVTFTYDCGVVANEATTADVNGQVKIGGLNPLLVNGAQNSIYPQTFVPWATSDEATAIVVARIINAVTGYSGYSAVAQGKHVVLTATASGAAINNAQVGVSTGATFCADDCSFAFAGSLFVINGITIDGTQILTKAHPFPSVKSASYSRALTLVTFNCGTAHGLTTGDKVVIAGCANANVNGTFTVTVTSTTQFTFNTATSGTIALAADTAGTVTIDATQAAFYARLVSDINSTTSAYAAATDGKLLYLTRTVTNTSLGDSTVVVTHGPNVVVTTVGTSTLTVKVTKTALSLSLVTDNFGGTLSAVVGPVRALASGGLGPYVFQWQFVNGTASIAANTPDSDTTSFGIGAQPRDAQSTVSAQPQQKSASFVCKVTDANGKTGFSPFVTIKITSRPTATAR